MTQPRKAGVVSRTCFGLNYLSLLTSHTEEFLSEDLPSDTGAQQRTTLSSRKKFFNPRTFGQGEDGKPLSNFMLSETELYLLQLVKSLVNWTANP